MAVNWTDLLKEQLEAIYGATQKLFQLVDSDKLSWKPETGNNWMTTGQLLMHCTNACGFCCKGLATGDWGEMSTDMESGDMLPAAEKLPTVESVEQAIKLLEEDKQLTLSCIAETGEEDLQNKVTKAPWGPECTLGVHFLDMIGHLENHKAQLYYYLKLQGKDVNTWNFYGMA